MWPVKALYSTSFPEAARTTFLFRQFCGRFWEGRNHQSIPIETIQSIFTGDSLK